MNWKQWVKGFWEEDDGSRSWARLAASFTVATGCWGFIHAMLKAHAIPDAATLIGLGGWMISPYGANKLITGIKEAIADKEKDK